MGERKEYWNLYSGAKTYATLMPHIDHYVEMLNEVESLVDGFDFIGDFASGAGLFTKRILQNGKSVVSVDQSEAMLEFLVDSIVKSSTNEHIIPKFHFDKSGKGIFHPHHLRKNQLQVYRADLNNLPFKNNYVDASVCLLALYNNEDPKNIVENLTRVTKDTVVISSFNNNFDTKFLLEKVEQNFKERNLYAFYGAQIMDFIYGNLEVIDSFMPTLLEAPQVSKMLLDAGCSSIIVEKPMYYNNGFIVAAKK